MDNLEIVQKCLVCGSYVKISVNEKLNIAQCTRCCHRYVDYRPTKSLVMRQDYEKEHIASWTRDIVDWIWHDRLQYLNHIKRGGKLLDIGAGDGYFLYIAKRTGIWEVQGTETSIAAIRIANDRFGISLKLANLEEGSDFESNSFDAITLWHVMEHLHHPAKIIKECRRILKHEGLLVLASPNCSIIRYLRAAIEDTIMNCVKISMNVLSKKRTYELKSSFKRYNAEDTWA